MHKNSQNGIRGRKHSAQNAIKRTHSSKSNNIKRSGKLDIKQEEPLLQKKLKKKGTTARVY